MPRFVLPAILLLSLGCHADHLRGSGRAGRDTREVPAFDGVEVESGIKVRVDLGARAPIELEGDDNLLALVETRVEDGRLQIRFRRRANLWSSGDVHVTVRAPSIRYLGASGGSEIRAEVGKVPALELSASGGADIHARGIDTEELAVEGSGGAGLELTGRTGKLSLDLSGGTRVKAGKLEAQKVRVSGSGGSTAVVRATDLLTGNLSGGSDVHLLGAASSRVSASGGSSVRTGD